MQIGAKPVGHYCLNMLSYNIIQGHKVAPFSIISNDLLNIVKPTGRPLRG
jgi:hypothetical protein